MNVKKIGKVLLVWICIFALLLPFCSEVLAAVTALTNTSQTAILRTVSYRRGGSESAGLASSSYDTTSYGYTISGKDVLKILQADDSDYTDTFYCINALGSLPQYTSNEFTYTNRGDFTDSNNEYVQAWMKKLGITASDYTALVNLLNIVYLMKQDTSYKEEFIESAFAAEIASFTATGAVSQLTKDEAVSYIASLITDDDIDVVQQWAIWYFTNRVEDDYTAGSYHSTIYDSLGSVSVTYDTYNSSTQTFSTVTTDLPQKRQELMSTLYEYLIETAQESSTSTSVTYPSIDDSSTVVTSEVDGSYYKVGPYKINSGTYNSTYSASFVFYDASGNALSDVSYIIKDASGNTVTSVGLDKEYYVYLPISGNTVSTVKLLLTYTTKTERVITIWSGEDTTADATTTYQDMQDVVLITTEEGTDESETKTGTIIEAEYDLALRKYIVSVNNKSTTGREPVVSDLDKLADGTSDDATYTHSKDAITVEVGDKIVYQFNVYNEGDIDAVVGEIVDYLPDGLEAVSTSESTINSKYGWVIDGNVVSTTVLSNTTIEAFDGTTLSSAYVQLECIVTGDFEEDTVLKNVAEIVTDNGDDRDSEPGSVDEDDVPDNYDDEDDDDYEQVKVVVSDGAYDLVLIKEDDLGEQLDSKAIFTVNGVEYTVTGKVTIADDVEINSSNYKTADTYVIKETVAPDSYCAFDGTITITVNKQLSGSTYSVKDIEYTVTDSNGTDITNSTNDVDVYLKDGNIYVEVKDFEQTSYTVNKVWNDENNKDGKRTSYKVTLTGTADGETVYTDTQTLSADTLTYTWNSLYKYYGETEIVYTVTESTIPDGYEVSYSTSGTTTIITNKYSPETTSVTVNKVWSDNDDQDGIRPSSVKVQLYADGVATGDSITLSNSNEWTYTWTDLDKYSSGTEISYTVKELNTSGNSISDGYSLKVDSNAHYYTVNYSTLGTTTTITNTYTPETIYINVYKTWDDEDDKDGLRPDSVTVQLYADGVAVGDTITLNESNDWYYYWSDLDKYSNGEAIEYYVREIDSNGNAVEDGGTYDENYIASYEYEFLSKEKALITTIDYGAINFTITNTHTPETTTVTVNKVWNDNNDSDIVRPSSVKVQLYADGVATGDIVTLSNSNEWTYTWTDLVVYSNGSKITYTVLELDEDENALSSGDNYDENYTVSYSTYGSTITVTNTHEYEKTTLKTYKIWNDVNNQDGTRSYYDLTVTGTVNGKEVYSQTIRFRSDQVEYEWTLPKYYNGTEITYSVEETRIPTGYSVDYKVSGSEVIITNNHTPAETPEDETTEIIAKKVWDDNNDQDGLRDTYKVTLTGTANGTTVYTDTQTLSSTTLTYKWTDLAVYSSGTEISYTITESSVPTGYTSSYEVSGNTTTITNKHTPETTIISVNKVWEDENDQDGVRPTEVVVQLYADGVATGETIILDDSNSWKYTWTNLVKYSNGVEIVYTVKELDDDGNAVSDGGAYNENYTVTYTISGSATTITNTHIPEEVDTVDVTVIKQWVDEDDKDGVRPSEIIVQLYANGEASGETVTLNEENSWTYTWSELEKYSYEETWYELETYSEIEYVVKELDSEGNVVEDNENYDENYVTTYSISNNTTTIINTHEVEVEEETIYDLALRKYIVSVNGEATTGREPTVSNLQALANGTVDTATYSGSKTAVSVSKGDTIIYEFRIYNEGNVDAVVETLVDYIPEGLSVVDASSSTINSKYVWTVGETTNGYTKVTTNSLSGTTIPAFDDENLVLSYAYVQIECEITGDLDTGTTLKNIAEITVDDGDDKDSTPGSIDEDDLPSGYISEDDDDYEQLVIEGGVFDLSLKKFITGVVSDSGTTTKITNREPEVNVDTLNNGGTDATYSMNKTPITVETGDIITYTIRVYNEGTISGYADEITDYIPEGLGFLVNYQTNYDYGWELESGATTVKLTDISNGTDNLSVSNFVGIDSLDDVEVVLGETKITTTALSSSSTSNLLNSFDGSELDYIDVQVTCIVVTEDEVTLKNIAAITSASDENKEEVEDRDSTPTDDIDPDNYGTGNEDDDDYDVIKTTGDEFDLALQKFITALNDDEITSREPVVTQSGDSITYSHTSESLSVGNGDYITYTIRIYNEGDIDGYASEIADDIPEGLVFVSDNEVNKTYGWVMYDSSGNVTTDTSQAVEVRTSYLENTLIKAYDGETLSYADVKIVFQVDETAIDSSITTSVRTLTNTAEITEALDEDKNPVDDIDSTPDNGDLDEDDIDQENVYVKYFDLALSKDLQSAIVTVDGTATTYNVADDEDSIKVEVNRKKVSTTTIQFVYNITVTNEGEIAGYATEVTDYIPSGLYFVLDDNSDWVQVSENVITTDALAKTLLEPGESATVQVVLRWSQSSDNTGKFINIAEITEDWNEYGASDIDSTPNNLVADEDDYDTAPVYVSISTGLADQPYIILTTTFLAILGTGIFLIKKYVI